MNPFGRLDEFRAKPIPDQSPARAARENCRSLPIDAADARYGEMLVPVAEFSVAGENYYYSTRNPPYWRRIDGAIADLLLRRSVAQRLGKVNARLGEAGLELYVFDAWRPRAVQVYFHDVWMPQEVRRRKPELEGAALVREVERYWARPTVNASSPAPHATGSAIDLSIRWKKGELLWMGSLFDDVTEVAHRDHFELAADSSLSFSNDEARANRRLLHWVMTDEGFAGHPDEWWHFSWGDQLWSAISGNGPAFYGPAEPDV